MFGISQISLELHVSSISLTRKPSPTNRADVVLYLISGIVVIMAILSQADSTSNSSYVDVIEKVLRRSIFPEELL